MSPGQRIRQIQSEEREATIDKIAGLPLSEPQREDVARIFAAVQQAVNQWLAAEDRTIDARIVPNALTLTVDELQRVYERLTAEGLTRDPG
jgi:hypothetical protein